MYGMLKNEQDMKKAEQEKWKNIISEAVCDGIIEAFSLLSLTPLTTEEPVYGLSAEVLEKIDLAEKISKVAKSEAKPRRAKKDA